MVIASAARSPSRTTATSINAAALRDDLERAGSIFQTTADSEIILHLLAQPSNDANSALSALRQHRRRVYR